MSAPSESLPFLPKEILNYIFAFCCEEGTTIEVGHRLHLGMPMTVVLSSVCARWREIAISSRSLWSSLAVEVNEVSDLDGTDDEKEEEEEAARFFRITELYLERAGDSPLSLSFREDGWSPPIECALDALCRRAHQWHSVAFETSNSFLKHRAFKNIRGKLINLRAASFIVSELNERAMLKFLGHCPALRHVHHDLGQDCCPRPEQHPHFAPWRHLKSLSLLLVHPEMHSEVLRIVDLCSSLVHLRLEFFAQSTEDHELDRRVCCTTNVQSLSLQTEGSFLKPVFEGLLPYINAPNLNSLYLHGDSEFHGDMLLEEDETCLLNFIHRSSCSIASLALDFTEFHDNATVHFLQLLPDLRCFSIRERKRTTGSYTAILFKHLLIPKKPSTAPLVLPHLTNFDAEVYSETLDHNAFVDAVVSRWIPDPEMSAKLGVDSIRSVSVRFIDGFSSGVSDSLKRWKALKSAGLRVSVPEAYVRT